MPEDTIQNAQITDEEFAAAAHPPDLRGRINLRIEQALQLEIENIAEDSRYPLNSSSQVVRYCCLVGLDRLRAWQPGETLLGGIKTANALLLRDQIQCETADLMMRMGERVKWYIDHEYYDECIDLVAKVRSYFDGLPEDFWAGRIRQEIDTKFIEWLDIIDAKRDLKGS